MESTCNSESSKNIVDFLAFLQVQADKYEDKNKPSSQYILMISYIKVGKYIFDVLKYEFNLKNIQLKSMKDKKVFGEYNGMFIFINEQLYLSDKESDLLIASRNICHELIHVFSDFFDLFHYKNCKTNDLAYIFEIRKKKSFKKKFFKQGIGLSNSMMLIPQKYDEIKSLEMFGSSSMGTVYFDYLFRNKEFLDIFKNVFSIPKVVKRNYLEELIAYSLCGTD